MNKKIRTEYLKKQLLQLNKENTEGYESLITKLSEQLEDNPKDILRHLLHAMDPNISNEEKIFEELSNLSEDWSAFYGLSKDLQKTTLRLAILEVISVLSEDVNTANLIWLGSRDIIENYQLKREKEILKTFFNDNLEKVVENYIPITNENLINFELETFTKQLNTKLDVNDLKNYMRAAAGAGHTHNELGNRYWASNNNTNWANDFSDISSKGINAFIEDFIQKQTKAINLFQEKLEQLLQNINKQIILISEQSGFQSKLLWWNKSLYSKSFKTSYRKIAKEDYSDILPIILAYDLSQLTSFIYPESVDYLLRETLNDVIKDEEIILKDWLEAIKKYERELERVLDYKSKSEGRILLLDFIQEKANSTTLENRLGIKEDFKITMSELTVWLFHNFQVQNYLNDEV